MNDPEKNKPTLTEDTAKKSNHLSRSIDKEEANQHPSAPTQLDLVSHIKNTTKLKKFHSKNNVLKKKFWLGQAQINLEALTGIDNLTDLLNKYGRLISTELIDAIYSGSIKIDSKPLSMSDLEAAYTELFETVHTETLYTNLLHNQEKEIYIISHTGIEHEDNSKDLFLNTLEASKRKAICNYIDILTHPYHISSTYNAIQLVDSGFTEETFKELCDKHACKKIYWIKWNESHMMLQQIYNPNFYTNRNFNKVVINNRSKRVHGLCTTLTQDTEDKFIFSGIVDDDYDALGKLLEVEPTVFNRDKIFVKQDLKISKDKFDKLSDTVHWLEVEGNKNNKQIIWRNSKGSLDGLRHYVDKKEYKSLYGESELLSAVHDRRVLIIAADPGMGKSTTLAKLYQLKSKQGTCNWVINIKLQNHLEAIKNINPDAINIADFLSAVNKDWKDKIAQDWLKFTLVVARNYKGPLLIVFDDFDKVTDTSDRNKVTALLTHLKNNTYVTFWVTTSLQYQKTLENALSTFAVTFKPLDADAQKDFIKQYLTNRLNLVCSEDGLNISEDGKIEEYSKAFINKLESTFQDDKSFIGIPLHFHLLLTGSKEEKNAEGHIVRKDCITSFKNWIRSNDEPDFSYIDKNRLEIYAKFIDGKYEIYFKKVGIIEQEKKNKLKSDVNKFCKKLAKQLVHSLQSDIEKNDIDMVLATGLVKSDRNDLAFIHPVLGEYFLSGWCTDLIIKERDTPHLTKWKLLLTSILIDVNYKHIRSFINANLANKQLTKKTFKRLSTVIKQLSNLESSIEKEKKLFEEATPLHVAAKEGNIHIAHFFLNSIQSFISKVDNNGNTALHIAVMHNHLDFVCYSLEPFKDNPEELKKLLEIQNNYGNTALHIAVMHDHLPFICYVLERFKDDPEELKKMLEIQNNYGNTTLHIAIKKVSLVYVDALLEPFKDNPEELKKLLEIQNNYGDTALHLAIKNGHTESIDDLIKYFDNELEKLKKIMKIQDNYGNTALHIAVMHDHLAFICYLLEPFKDDPEEVKKLLEIENNYGDTALHLAIKNGHTGSVDALLKPFDNALEKLNKLLEVRYKNGNTVLHTAAEKDDKVIHSLLKPFEQDSKALKKLLKIQDNNGYTALHIAATKSKLVFIDFLLKCFERPKKLKKLISIQNSCGETALHIAVYKDNCSGIASLVKPFEQDLGTLKKWIKKADEHGNTLVHMAADKGDYNIIADLLQPFEKNVKELSEIIKPFNNNKETALHIALQKKHYKFFADLLKPFDNDLIKYTEYLKTIGSYKETVLHIALQEADYDFINSLLKPLEQDKKQLKKVIQNQNKDKKTILHIAAEKGDEQFVTALLKPFKDDSKALQEIIITKDNYQETALHIALQKGHNNFAISLLKPLKHDKKQLEKITKIKNKDGKTAYEVRKNQNTTNEMRQLFFGKVNKQYRSSVYSDGMISPLTQSMASLITQDESLQNISFTSNSYKSCDTLFQTNERSVD